MENIEATVAAQESAAEMPAADAQAAEISVEEVLSRLHGAADSETADTQGDGGPAPHNEAQEKANEPGGESGKRDNQMRAALRQQRRTIFEKDLGMPEEQVRELIRAHKAAELAKADPEISQKAARMIVEAQERAEAEEQDSVQVTQAQRDDVLSLMSEGWTQEQLLAFAQDRQAMEDVLAGKSVSEAASAYKSRHAAAEPEAPAKRKAAPIARGTSAGSTPVKNPIEAMSDEEYDAFMADVRRRAMRGEKVKF